MLDFIRSINGRDFLIFFPIYSFFIIFTFRLFMPSKSTTNSHHDELDAYSIAVLKGNKNISYLAQTILFKMWTEKYIEVVDPESKVKFRSIETNTNKLNDIERDFYSFFSTPVEFGALLSWGRLKAFAKDQRKKLVDIGFIKSDSELRGIRIYKITALLVMLLPGLIKFGMGTFYNKPVGFLALEIIILSLILICIFSTSYLTKKGQYYLKRKESYCSGIRNQKAKTGFTGEMDMAYAAVALLGASAISTIPDFGMFSKAVKSYPPTFTDNSNNSGSSCSSSSCSSSGCSSSSCGGGGCGGCGGS